MSSDAAAAELAGAPRPGETFAGKYRIDSLLGVGGMGFVLAATHLTLDEKVAIKMLLPELADEPETVARFLQEGRAAVKIRSEHVCRILDVGSHEGVHYIVMEYLEGCDLAALVEREERVPAAAAVDYVLQACEAIAEAHALRIVHRDLKPANLFLVRRADGAPCVKVLDFGISKMAAPEAGLHLSMTKSAVLMGSPLYMSPEQLRSAKNVDARTDVWALGVILYELVSGKRPFAAETLPELGALVFSGRVPDLRAAAPDAPPELASAVATCLRNHADERFPSVAELAQALAPLGTAAARGSAERIARVLASAPRPTWSLPPPTAAPSPSTLALARTEPQSRVRARRLGVALALVAIGAAGAVTFAFRRNAHDGAAAKASATEKPAAQAVSAPVEPTPKVETVEPPLASAATATSAHARRERHATVATHAAAAPSTRPAPRPIQQAPAPSASATDGFSKGRFE